MLKMTFTSLSPIEWETKREGLDFHIQLERDDYVIDVFDSSIDNADEAYLTTHTCETWEQVESYCLDYDGITVI